MKSFRPSLLWLLGLSVIFAVSILMLIHSTLSYQLVKSQLIESLKNESQQSSLTLANNISGFVQAYAPNEYVKLLHHQMENPHYLAMIVSDYEMSKLIGKDFISGKIRGKNGDIHDFNYEHLQHQQWLESHYHHVHHDILDNNGEPLGWIELYLSNTKINKELNQLIWASLLQGIGVTSLLLIILFIIIQRFALTPLSQIEGKINITDNEGIPLNLIKVSGAREITSLTNSMNRMISAIRNSRDTLKEQRDQIYYQANHDQLTGLANRYLFNDRLNQALKKAKRYQSSIAIIFIDLDHFKEVNDSYGHDIGDKLLKQVTLILHQLIRDEDVISRLGGDEFVVMIEQIHDIYDSSILAQKIIEALSLPIEVEEYELFIGCSIGISLYPDNGQTAKDLLKQADAAMYKAKECGRNTYEFFISEMTEKAIEKLTLESSLRLAVRDNEFVAYYQPQVDVREGQLIGMEALVRWNSPTMGLVAPSQFISVAETIGKMVEIDRLMMQQALQQVSSWRKMGLNPGVLSLNLTLQHLLTPDFIPKFMTILHNSGCDIQQVELEITENHIMSNPDQTIRVLNQLKEIGIRLSLDDFGTGYSSLGHLKNFPVDKIKIDRSFVKDLPGDPNDIAIIKSVIALSEGMNLQVLAEGVETKEQQELLLSLGCYFTQGYFSGKPHAAADMKKRLIAEKSGSSSSIIFLEDKH